MPSIVSMRDVCFEYSRRSEEEESQQALFHAGLEVEKGSFVAVIGHNGSGKSTLAKHINALLLPDSGEVLVDGLLTSDPQNLWEIRRKAGMVFQNPDNQIVASIVEEDVAFGPENLGVPRTEIRQRVDAALSVVRMEQYVKHATHMLSGGQKQRVAIAGILAMEPEILVMDEPTAMLDPVGRQEVMETVMHLNQEKGMTIILITHFMEEALRAQKVAVMDNGRVIMEGTPREVFQQEETLRKAGLDVPPMVELAGRMRAEGVEIPGNIINVEEMAETLWAYLQKI